MGARFIASLFLFRPMDANRTWKRDPDQTKSLSHYLVTSLLLPPVSSQPPYTAAKPPVSQSTRPPADNSPPPRSTSAPPLAPTHSACAQNRSSRRPSA